MQRIPRPTWQRAVEAMCERLDETLERMADAIKDALLDGELDRDLAADDEGQELPPLPRGEFVAVLRGKVEETLGRVADVINAAPAGRVSIADEEQIRDLFTELWCIALERGLQMRHDTAAIPRQGPQGEWARKLRQMTLRGDRDSRAHPARSGRGGGAND